MRAAGDDVICVVDGPEIASADGPEYVVLAGAGDDIVDSTALSADKHGFAVSASAGSDSFFGGPADEQLTLGADPQQVQMGGGDDVVRNVFPDIPRAGRRRPGRGPAPDRRARPDRGRPRPGGDGEGPRTTNPPGCLGVRGRRRLGPPGVPAGDGRGQRAVPADQRLRLRRRPPGDDDLRIGVRSGTPAFPNAGREAHGGGGDDVLRGSFLDDELGAAPAPTRPSGTRAGTSATPRCARTASRADLGRWPVPLARWSRRGHHLPAGAAGLAAPRRHRRRHPGPPGRGRGRRDRLGQDHPAPEDLPGAGPGRRAAVGA